MKNDFNKIRNLSLSAAIVAILFSCSPAYASSIDSTAQNVQTLLKIAPNTTNQEITRILRARTLLLSDSATDAEIANAVLRKHSLYLAKQNGWSENLSVKELSELVEKKKRSETLLQLGLSETASENEIQKAENELREKETAIMEEYRLKRIDKSGNVVINDSDLFEQMRQKQLALSLAGEARLEGLSITASQSEISKAHDEKIRTQAALRLGLKEHSNWQTINDTQAKLDSEEIAELTRRIFKASKTDSEAQLANRLTVVAKALGYPAHSSSNHNGELYLTLEELLQYASSPKISSK